MLAVGSGWLSPWVPRAAPITYSLGRAPTADPAEGRLRSKFHLGRYRLPLIHPVEAHVSALQFEPFDRIIRNNVSDV